MTGYDRVGHAPAAAGAVRGVATPMRLVDAGGPSLGPPGREEPRAGRPQLGPSTPNTARRVLRSVAAALAFSAGGGTAMAQSADDWPPSGLTQAERKEIVRLINAERASVSPSPLTTLPEVKWDDELARETQAWADRLRAHPDQGHASGGDMNRGWENRGGVVENAGANTEPGVKGVKAIVDAWTSEKTNNFRYALFPDTNIPTRAFPGSGHYLPMVWHTTTRVGCGAVTLNVPVTFQVIEAHPDGRNETRTVTEKRNQRSLYCRFNPAGNRCHEFPWPSDQAVADVGDKATRPPLGVCEAAPAPASPVMAFQPGGPNVAAGTFVPVAARRTQANAPAARVDASAAAKSAQPAQTSGSGGLESLGTQALAPVADASLLEVQNDGRKEVPALTWSNDLAADAVDALKRELDPSLPEPSLRVAGAAGVGMNGTAAHTPAALMKIVVDNRDPNILDGAKTQTGCATALTAAGQRYLRCRWR